MKNIILILITLLLAIGCGPSEKKYKIVKKQDIAETKAKSKIKITANDKPANSKIVEPSVPPEQIKKAKEMIESSADKIADVDAMAKFKSLCSICHGFNGNLMVNGAKDLTKSNISLEESVAQVYFGKGLMTPFKGIMKDEEIVAVAKYIETMRN